MQQCQFNIFYEWNKKLMVNLSRNRSEKYWTKEKHSVANVPSRQYQVCVFVWDTQCTPYRQNHKYLLCIWYSCKLWCVIGRKRKEVSVQREKNRFDIPWKLKKTVLSARRHWKIADSSSATSTMAMTTRKMESFPLFCNENWNNQVDCIEVIK